MKITFLGTSAGKPTKERGLSAIGVAFEQSNKWYLFDCGEGTQFQLMYSNLRIGKLAAIFITHLHGDHFYGLPGLLASKKMDDALSSLTIYGPKGIRHFLECVLEVSESHLGYDLQIIEYEIDQEFVFDKFVVKVLPLVHSIESVAFYIRENDISDKLDEAKLRSVGLEPSALYGELKRGKSIVHDGEVIEPHQYMLEPIKGSRVMICGDNASAEVLDGYLDDLDLLVHEATYTQDIFDHLKKKVLHSTAKDLAKTAQKHHVKNLIATHISPRYSEHSKYDISILYDELKAYYDGRVFVANDFDEYELKRSEGVIKKL